MMTSTNAAAIAVKPTGTTLLTAPPGGDSRGRSIERAELQAPRSHRRPGCRDEHPYRPRTGTANRFRAHRSPLSGRRAGWLPHIGRRPSRARWLRLRIAFVRYATVLHGVRQAPSPTPACWPRRGRCCRLAAASSCLAPPAATCPIAPAIAHGPGCRRDISQATFVLPRLRRFARRTAVRSAIPRPPPTEAHRRRERQAAGRKNGFRASRALPDFGGEIELLEAGRCRLRQRRAKLRAGEQVRRIEQPDQRCRR